MLRNEKIFLLTAIFLMIFILIKIINQSSDISQSLYYINQYQSEYKDRFLSLDERLSSINNVVKSQNNQPENKCKNSKNNRNVLLEAAYILNKAVKKYEQDKKKSVAIKEVKRAKKFIWQVSDKDRSHSKSLKKLMPPIDGLIKKIDARRSASGVDSVIDKLDVIIGEMK